jgi:hypothetical protein
MAHHVDLGFDREGRYRGNRTPPRGIGKDSRPRGVVRNCEPSRIYRVRVAGRSIIGARRTDSAPYVNGPLSARVSFNASARWSVRSSERAPKIRRSERTACGRQGTWRAHLHVPFDVSERSVQVARHKERSLSRSAEAMLKLLNVVSSLRRALPNASPQSGTHARRANRNPASVPPHWTIESIS